MFKNFFANEEGQGVVEYGLIIALIAVVLIGVLGGLGDKLKAVFTGISNNINEDGSIVVPTGE